MKTALFASALLATALFANNGPVGGSSSESTARRDDSAKIGASAHQNQLPTLPDSLKAKIETQVREFESQKALFQRDSGKGSENRVALDSLRKVWEAKRDTQVANIKNDTVRAKVEARIQKVSAHKAAVKAKIEAKKAKIEAKKATRPVPATPAQ